MTNSNLYITIHFWGYHLGNVPTCTRFYPGIGGELDASVDIGDAAILVDRDGARRLADLFTEVYHKLADEPSGNLNLHVSPIEVMPVEVPWLDPPVKVPLLDPLLDPHSEGIK